MTNYVITGRIDWAPQPPPFNLLRPHHGIGEEIALTLTPQDEQTLINAGLILPSDEIAGSGRGITQLTFIHQDIVQLPPMIDAADANIVNGITTTDSDVRHFLSRYAVLGPLPIPSMVPYQYSISATVISNHLDVVAFGPAVVYDQADTLAPNTSPIMVEAYANTATTWDSFVDIRPLSGANTSPANGEGYFWIVCGASSAGAFTGPPNAPADDLMQRMCLSLRAGL